MKNKRKILMITPYIPRLSQSGGQNSSFYSIKYLASDNDITLICFSRDREGLEEVEPYCQKVVVINRGKTWDIKKILSTGFGPYPFLVTNYISAEFRHAIQSELDHQHFDLIHCDCFYPMPNIPQTKIPIVLVDLTIEYAVYRHYIQSLKGWKRLLVPLLMIDVVKLKYWETHYWKNTHTVVAFGQDDQKLISRVTGRSDIRYFQNGVDKKFYDSPPKAAKTSFPSILFGVSNMKWMQNRESADLILRDLWPKIKRKIPRCRLYIIGRFATEFFGHLNQSDIIVSEADQDGQPHDPQFFYHQSWVLLAPMGSGGGTRNKFLEAMACYLPIITTPEGVGGIAFENHRHAIIASYNDIAKETIKLLQNRQLRQKIGKAANKLIRNKYSYQQSIQGLNQIYEEITGK